MHNSEDYTFYGLLNNGLPTSTPIDTLAYVVGLVDTAANVVSIPDEATFVLRSLFDADQEAGSVGDLISRQKDIFPDGYRALTPVMLAIRWSPISALLEPIS